MATLVTPPNGFGRNTTVASAAVGFVPNFQNLNEQQEKLKNELSQAGTLFSQVGNIIKNSILNFSNTLTLLGETIESLKNSNASGGAVGAPSSAPSKPESPGPGGSKELIIKIITGSDNTPRAQIPIDLTNIENSLAELEDKIITVTAIAQGKQTPPPSIA